MLEERMSWTEASVRDKSPAGGTVAARAQEAPGAHDGRFGFGAFAAKYQPENFSGEDTGWRDWSLVFSYLGQDGFNEDDYKKSSEQWRQHLEMMPL